MNHESVTIPARYDVFGAGVHALDLKSAAHLVVQAGCTRSGGYVCFCDVNSAMSAARDPAHRRRLNESFLTTPDGMPIVWMGRHAGYRGVTRVYGPDLLLEVAAATAGTELSHYFYGAGPGTASELVERLTAKFPGLQIAGARTPPFRALSDAEADQLRGELARVRPSFLWVGLSTPKQEAFMAEFAPTFAVGVSLGVGAAFDFLSGRVKQAPRLVQRTGLEWIWRLCHEPRRLGPRYLKNNPAFVLRVLREMARDTLRGRRKTD